MNSTLARWLADNRDTLLLRWKALQREALPVAATPNGNGAGEHPGADIDLPRLGKPYNQAQLAKEITKVMAGERAPIPRSGSGASASRSRLSKSDDRCDEIGDGACVV